MNDNNITMVTFDFYQILKILTCILTQWNLNITQHLFW